MLRPGDCLLGSQSTCDPIRWRLRQRYNARPGFGEPQDMRIGTNVSIGLIADFSILRLCAEERKFPPQVLKASGVLLSGFSPPSRRPLGDKFAAFAEVKDQMTTEIEKDITHMLAEVVEMDEAELWEKRNARFVEELGVDSMLALEILALLEKKYRIEIPEENLLDLVSLQSTIDFVDQKLKQRAA